MRNSRYSSTRQKACQNCSSAKARCDRSVGRCNRCSRRGITCIYPQSHPAEEYSQHTAPTNNDGGPCSPASLTGSLNTGLGDESGLTTMTPSSRISDFSSTANIIMNTGSPESSATFRMTPGRRVIAPTTGPAGSAGPPHNDSAEVDSLNFSKLNLTCPISVDGIASRWMNPFIPDDEQRIKSYPPKVIIFLSRTLKSYAASAIRGRDLLPFIHPTQMKHQTPPPLTTCLSLIRMCQNPLPGTENAAIMIFQREMENIAASAESYDDISLLAAFQAYIIYSMVLFFQLDVTRDSSFRQTMITLQELAHASCKGGCVCAADQYRARPRWEEWIISEAKRRTLYMMYLFDGVVSTRENIPTYLGTELQGLPAPAAKQIWEANTRVEWEQAYNVFLAEWMEPGLVIDELWPIPSDMNESDIERRRNRVDHWLEDIDSYGTMLYAVTSCTHGG